MLNFRGMDVPKFNSEFTPANVPGPKRKGSSSNHHFSGASCKLRGGIYNFKDFTSMIIRHNMELEPETSCVKSIQQSQPLKAKFTGARREKNVQTPHLQRI